MIAFERSKSDDVDETNEESVPDDMLHLYAKIELSRQQYELVEKQSQSQSQSQSQFQGKGMNFLIDDSGLEKKSISEIMDRDIDDFISL